MDFQTLVDTLSAFGVPGLIAAAVILIGVFIAKKSGLVATGDQARIANVLLSAVLFGISDNPQAEGALLAVLSSLLAALAFTGLEWLNAKRIINTG
jgi:hypothetical protein